MTDNMPKESASLIGLSFTCQGQPVTVPMQWPTVLLATKDDGWCSSCGWNHSTVEAVVECPACGGTHTFELGADQETM